MPARQKKQMVLIYAYTRSGYYLVVLKDRPEWMKDKLNLLGGKVEDGELPEQAVYRELEEEAGVYSHHLLGPAELLGEMRYFEANISVYRILLKGMVSINPRGGESERPYWTTVECSTQNRLLISNLRAIIPLCAAGVKGWVLNELVDGTIILQFED